MQSLRSCLSSKGDLWIVPPLGSEQKESCRCRRRRTGFLLLASNSRVYKRPKFELRYGFSSAFSRIKVDFFSKRKRTSLSALTVTASPLEQEAIGSEFGIDELSSEGKSIEKSKSREEGNSPEKSRRIDVRELALSLRFAKTADDVGEALQGKGDLPLQVYSTVIRGLGKEKLLDSALALVEWMKRKTGSTGPNLFIYNSLLGAVKQSERFEEMDRVLEDMAREGFSRNVVTYNAIMAIYLEQGKPQKALSVLDEIRNVGFSPSPVTYSTATLAYRKMGDAFGAVNFFVTAREKYAKGEIGNADDRENWGREFVKLESLTIRVCYQVMREWLVKEEEDLSTEVLKLLMAMDNARIPPGRSEYERLLWACTRQEHALVAMDLYSRVRERHSEIGLSVCNHAMWLMGKAKKWWTALEIYEDLLDKGPKPNNMSHEIIVSHFNVLLRAARRRGIWKWGIRLLDKMEEKGLEPGSREWNAVLVACSKASETSAAVKIFARMVDRGQKPTVLSYGALLSALEKGKLYGEARRVWEHMLRVGLRPDVYAYTTMASVFAAQGKLNLVDEILREMASSGIEPTVVTYNAIISGCARNETSSAAFEWLRRMRALGVPPNNVTYEIMIRALASDRKPRLAFELYTRARNEGLELAPKAYDALVESSRILGATVDLRLLGPRPPDRKGKSSEIEE